MEGGELVKGRGKLVAALGVAALAAILLWVWTRDDGSATGDAAEAARQEAPPDRVPAADTIPSRSGTAVDPGAVETSTAPDAGAVSSRATAAGADAGMAPPPSPPPRTDRDLAERPTEPGKVSPETAVIRRRRAIELVEHTVDRLEDDIAEAEAAGDGTRAKALRFRRERLIQRRETLRAELENPPEEAAEEDR